MDISFNLIHYCVVEIFRSDLALSVACSGVVEGIMGRKTDAGISGVFRLVPVKYPH